MYIVNKVRKWNILFPYHGFTINQRAAPEHVLERHRYQRTARLIAETFEDQIPYKWILSVYPQKITDSFEVIIPILKERNMTLRKPDPLNFG
jgi:hypothetical protein